VAGLNRRRDGSRRPIKGWHRDFGDGHTSTEPSPVHRYQEAGKYLAVLDVEGPAGKGHMTKLWDVAVK
jgi:PKD repeat protein